MQNDDFSKFLKLFQEVSLSRLQWLIGDVKFESVADIPLGHNVFERWLCLIQLSHQDFRLIFKCHFGESLCSHLLKKPLTVETMNPCFDQIRELCNLVIGGVKASLGDMRLGVSLPLVLGGFDEVFLRPPSNKLQAFNVWAYRCEKFVIYFSVEAMIFNPEVYSKLESAIAMASGSQGGETELF